MIYHFFLSQSNLAPNLLRYGENNLEKLIYAASTGNPLSFKVLPRDLVNWELSEWNRKSCWEQYNENLPKDMKKARKSELQRRALSPFMRKMADLAESQATPKQKASRILTRRELILNESDLNDEEKAMYMRMSDDDDADLTDDDLRFQLGAAKAKVAYSKMSKTDKVP